MYNLVCDYQMMQNMYYPYCYEWNYPIIYVPMTQSPIFIENDYSTHYQVQKRQLSSSNDQSNNFQSEKANDEEFVLEKQSQEIHDQNLDNFNKKRKYYGTKNTEANIINQTFSFMNCSSKSEKILRKLLHGDQQKVQIFYVMMKIVKRNLKKYVNRTYLKSIFEMDRSYPIYKLLSKGIKRLEIMSVIEFQQIFKKLAHYYFNNEMVTHILSSTRLSKNTIEEHLKRRREIMSIVFHSVRLY